jgi:serine/threonine protein phosphatase 1
MLAAIPARMIDFIRTFEDQVQIGDYLFVHAGIAPTVGLEAQKRSDLRWIREPFLSHEGWHGAVVVHGHTISDDPQVRENRIGIDTGAYASGVLTALGLEGDQRWLISARAGENGIETFTQEA